LQKMLVAVPESRPGVNENRWSTVEYQIAEADESVGKHDHRYPVNVDASVAFKAFDCWKCAH
jgi:hypothetical protein